MDNGKTTNSFFSVCSPREANSEIVLFKQWIDRHVHGLRTGQLAVERGVVGEQTSDLEREGSGREASQAYSAPSALTCGHDCLKSENAEEEKLSEAMPEELAQLRSVTGKRNDFEEEDRVSG